MAQQMVHYTAVFEPAEEGGYVATFPAFPHLATQGETLEEAQAMAGDCLRGYLEALWEAGQPLPPSEAHAPEPLGEAGVVERNWMSCTLPSLASWEVHRALERGGFVLHRVRGSHHFYKHPDNPARLVVVPESPGDLKRDVLRSLIHQAAHPDAAFLPLLRASRCRVTPSHPDSRPETG